MLVDGALATWSANVTGALTQAESAARSAQAEVDSVLRERANEVAAIEALLVAAADEKRHGELQHRLSRAKDAHARAQRASVKVANVATRVARLHRSNTTATVPQVDGARSQLATMRRALDGYRSGGTSLGGVGPAPTTSRHAATTGSAGDGVVALDVGAANLDENPILDDNLSQGTFGKGGLSRADYRWAVQTWNDVVGPGVATGKTREHFAERDEQSGARPLRRTADVYDMFLGSDRIRADRMPDGSLDIVNGRHRLLIARELGIDSLPGQVHG